jgi:hypothetical protein
VPREQVGRHARLAKARSLEGLKSLQRFGEGEGTHYSPAAAAAELDTEVKLTTVHVPL